jgi:hypothetical protein
MLPVKTPKSGGDGEVSLSETNTETSNREKKANAEIQGCNA